MWSRKWDYPRSEKMGSCQFVACSQSGELGVVTRFYPVPDEYLVDEIIVFLRLIFLQCVNIKTFSSWTVNGNHDLLSYDASGVFFINQDNLMPSKSQCHYNNDTIVMQVCLKINPERKSFDIQAL